METTKLKRIFISCAPGLEPGLIRECRALGIERDKTNTQSDTISDLPAGEDKGGIEFEGTDAQIFMCNLHLRTASRVIVRLGEFYAAAFSELRKKAGRLEWEQYLRPGQAVEIKVTCHKSKLYHSDAVAERVRGAIEDRLKQAPKEADKEKPSQIVLVRLVNDLCTISVDTSGELLHRRGYRQAVAKAPLRETLAAGLLYAANWQGETPLVDPFCGSGTIPIEAAMIARHIAPGINRRFAFQDWPIFKLELFKSFLEEARKEIKPTDLFIYAADRDRGAIEMATANAARTGVNADIHFACHAISDLPHFETTGSLITNPPYGVRIVSSKDLRNLYASFGKVLRTSYQGWQVGVLCSEEALIAALEIGPATKVIQLNNGGIPVKFSLFTIN
ncbi:MAG: class I SAM-dependent RNA methyltransferase [Anaerolineaceae bacterium]